MRPMIRPLTGPLILVVLMTVSGCTTVDQAMQQQSAPQPVHDDRPMPTWNRLMKATLPVVREALEPGEAPFYPRAFALSRRGGVRSVHISPRAGADHEERLELLFNSLEVMLSGDDIVAFVVYATGQGTLLNSSDRNDMVVAHMEHYSGKAVLRRLSYRIDNGSVTFGKEDVNGSKALVMDGNGQP